MNRRESSLTIILVLCAGVVFALGINGYIMPESTDDLIYMEGARNLAEHGTYTLDGKIISDWPPFHPVLLAGVFLILGSSLIAAKVVSVLMALISLWLGARLLTAENRRFKWPALAVYAFLPTGFLCAVRNGSDWTYIALSLVFLLLLRKLAVKRQLWLAVLAGLVLGCAALTRNVGVLLGAAVIAQAVAFLLGKKRPVFWKAWPEVLIGVIGAAMWLSWPVFLKLSPEGTVTPGLYELNGSSLVSNIDPLSFFSAVGDYFAQLPNVLAKLGLGGGLVEMIVSGVLGLIILIGFWRSVFGQGFRASDYYVIAYMALICSYVWKLPRFMIPVGPWLILYLIEGMAFLGSLLVSRRKAGKAAKWQPAALAVAWCGLAVMMNLLLIFHGHPGKLHEPLFAWATDSQDEFYGDFYKELSKTGTLLSSLPESAVIGTEGFYANYLRAFSGRKCVDPRLFNGVPDVFVQIDGYQETGELPEYAKTWTEVHAAGRVRVLAPHALAFTTPIPKS